jgi:septal ring factor EnvC (AmiA/AmiB activator)
MAYENFPSETGTAQAPVKAPKANLRALLTGGLLVALLGTWGYIIYDKNKSKESIAQKDNMITTASQERDELQKELDNATSRFDELKTDNAKKDSSMLAKDNEIAEKKSRIQSLLSKVNATQGELAEARRLIRSLNGDIDGYKMQVEQLKGENLVLTQEKEVITQDRDRIRREYDSTQTNMAAQQAVLRKEKEEVVDVASTLHASNFNILPIDERKGGKEKTAKTAKRADKLRVSFDLDENRVAQSGNKDVYICITDPSGNPIAVEALGSGKFNTRDGQEKLYTKKIDVLYTQGQRQTVNVDWKQDKFVKGSYKVEVYHNGFKIGEGYASIKRTGGLFS